MRALASTIDDNGHVVNTIVEIKSYKDYYPLIKADLFDVVSVEWDGEPISIFLDDEGLLKNGVYGRDVEGYDAPLFGNFVVCGGVDKEGETLPLPTKFNRLTIENYISKVRYQTR